jgi:hypothetical protein
LGDVAGLELAGGGVSGQGELQRSAGVEKRGKCVDGAGEAPALKRASTARSKVAWLCRLPLHSAHVCSTCSERPCVNIIIVQTQSSTRRASIRKGGGGHLCMKSVAHAEQACCSRGDVVV